MKIMGILNVTPDSFSDGGRWDTPQAAIAQGKLLQQQGAEIIDVGGESTRPGAAAISPTQEWGRIAEVVRELSSEITVSVDTYHSETAAAAVAAGAAIVNDVTGGQGDPRMFATIAELDCLYILQHGRGNARTMNSLNNYAGDIVEVVCQELLTQRDAAVEAGIAPERIILDPGLGFAKLGKQDWQVLAGIEKFNSLGHRVLIGQSRKRFLAAVDPDASAPDRDLATAVLSGILWEKHIWAVRVHNVAASRQAITVHKLLAEQRV